MDQLKIDKFNQNFKWTPRLPLLVLCESIIGIFCLSAGADVPFRGFTDFSYIWDNSTSTNYFQIHDLDVFTAGSIDKHVSYLAEINFQPGFDGVSIDLERTYAQYTVSSWFKIAMGRVHTALGFWNDTYHHGSYLATAATRPMYQRFEDAGGLLPVHNTGIEIRGNGAVGSGNLGYIFNIGNGRGPVKDPTSFFFSYSKSKSVSAVAYYEFENGLRVGGNFWASDLPGGATLSGDSTPSTNNLNSSSGLATNVYAPGSSPYIAGPKGSEVILGAHIIYNSADIEWLTEYEHMTHSYVGGSDTLTGFANSNPDGSLSTSIDLVYSQLGYHIGLFTPYIRYEMDATSTADGYLNASPGYKMQGLWATTRYYVAGARYELSAASALKFEATYISSGAPIFLANMSNNSPPTSTTDWITNLNWSLAW